MSLLARHVCLVLCASIVGAADVPLFASVQVAQLSASGSVRMPHGTKRVFIEIGCSDWGTLDEEALPLDPEAFLLSFEPLLDKYAVLAARGATRYHGRSHDLAVPLGHSHPRAVIMPFAVAPEAGMVNISVVLKQRLKPAGVHPHNPAAAPFSPAAPCRRCSDW